MSQPITEKTQPEKVIAGHNQNIHPRSPSPHKKQIRHINSSAENRFRKVEYMTLEDCLLASPNINVHPRITGGEIQMFKHLPKRVYPSSSSPDVNQEFFTPRRSFSSGANNIGRIDEDDELDGDHDSMSMSSISRSESGKVKKKVSFRLPEESDIYIYYTPKDVFEE